MTFGNGKFESFGLILDENFEVILLDESFDFVLRTNQPVHAVFLGTLKEVTLSSFQSGGVTVCTAGRAPLVAR